ncbi:HsdM family class I SAM-dependent methyltransferase [Spiroplasma endosymbiont of Polydrusus pterygomalis]|uniref:HsdM family class I SAM-dependent methyltransferase n=1 Tax=Spiroplasma endosymbiont of Polydrusus pterygomalis TaxID=3139327 RepID=UPI003CCAAD61
MKKTEDQVKEEIKNIIGISVGQHTTFKELGFNWTDLKKIKVEIQNMKKEFNINEKTLLSLEPDGWYFDEKKSCSIIVEAKNSLQKIDSKAINQLKKYILIAKSKYKNVIGVLYNGIENKVFWNFNEYIDENLLGMTIKNKEYYLDIPNNNLIDKNKIYAATKTINDILHFDFLIKNLNHRMIWTACILVAKRFGCNYNIDDSIATIKHKTIETIHKQIEEELKINSKLNKLEETFKLIQYQENVDINKKELFINSINSISENIDSKNWNGEDVMAIFFNEFTRYKGKSENGQVFTPDHITSLMYKITKTNMNDRVLDACCGSGSFLVKAMCNMIKEAGGNKTKKSLEIKRNQLFGIEVDPEIYALACANMLIHKDGKSNINCDNALSQLMGNWIKEKQISKVLMNPPYEQKSKPIAILENVLNNVQRNATCAFLLPNSKLRTNWKKVQKILWTHKLTHIIKLPDIFQNMASTGSVSIFIFNAHQPQNNEEIFTCWIKEDGLVTVKNQGRHDINSIWKNDLEDYWVEAINKKQDIRNNTVKWIKPNEFLEYPDEEIKFEIFHEDFKKTVLERIFFENPDIAKKFEQKSGNNPNGLTQSDWIVYALKNKGEL